MYHYTLQFQSPELILYHRSLYITFPVTKALHHELLRCAIQAITTYID